MAVYLMSGVRLSFFSVIRSDERTVLLPQVDMIWIPDYSCVFPGAATSQTYGGEDSSGNEARGPLLLIRLPRKRRPS